jgi:hypothetical protein
MAEVSPTVKVQEMLRFMNYVCAKSNKCRAYGRLENVV